MEPKRPIRLIHWFLWIACVCTLVALNRQFVAGQSETQLQLQIAVGSSIVNGFCVACLFLFLFQDFVAEPQFPVLPGHFLLLSLGIQSVSSNALALYWNIFGNVDTPQGGVAIIYWLAFAVENLLVFGLAYWAFRSQWERINWRIVFALIGIESLGSAWRCLGEAAIAAELLIPLAYFYWPGVGHLATAASVGACIAAVLDRYDEQNDDWLHYGGIVVTILSAALVAVSYLSQLDSGISPL